MCFATIRKRDLDRPQITKKRFFPSRPSQQLLLLHKSPNINHKNTAAATAAKAPNLASSSPPGVATAAAAVELAVPCSSPPPMTDRTILNWSETCCSLKARTPLGSAVYQSGLVRKVCVGPSIVTVEETV